MARHRNSRIQNLPSIVLVFSKKVVRKMGKSRSDGESVGIPVILRNADMATYRSVADSLRDAANQIYDRIDEAS